jgi:hypothetical protein
MYGQSSPPSSALVVSDVVVESRVDGLNPNSEPVVMNVNVNSTPTV